MLSDSSDLTWAGNAFQALVAATGKARSPSMERLVGGTSRVTVSLDRVCRLTLRLEVRRTDSAKYAGWFSLMLVALDSVSWSTGRAFVGARHIGVYTMVGLEIQLQWQCHCHHTCSTETSKVIRVSVCFCSTGCKFTLFLYVWSPLPDIGKGAGP